MTIKTERKSKYFEGVGRRKTAVARVRFFPEEGKKGEASIMVNGLDYKNYFPLVRYRQAAAAPLRLLSQPRGRIEVKVGGGGVMAQAEAITLGLARALVKFNPELKTQLRAFGYLTRDPRMVERKKYGLKKARRAPQWSKR